MVLTALGFLLCAVVIFFGGVRLAKYGDHIAERTGIGKAWFGLIMMAAVTSLPELFVGISSSSIVASADLAVGDVLGSCVFNLAILSLLDALSGGKNIFSVAGQSHVLAGSFGIILLSLVGIAIVLPGDMIIIGWIGMISVIFILVYLISIKLVYQHERNQLELFPNTQKADLAVKGELKKSILKFVISAIIVIAAALILPRFAEEISNSSGLDQTIIGTLLLAASTSLPEVAVSIAALRIGSIDIAVGNLMGSNLFNIFILAIDDFFYTKGYLLKDASDSHIVSVFSTIIMTSIAIAGLTYRAKEKSFFLAWDTLLILLVYIINMVLLYQFNQS